MSMQQGLGIIGGIVGAFFGYPQLGFVVGSLVGGLLTPGEKTEGPRLDDRKVSVSTYGVGKGINYGNNVWGGNWLWSTDKIEQETTTGGKGGEPENTTYRYYIHGFLALCESPPAGVSVAIRKMWVDGKLQWDRSSGIPVGSALASEENPHAAIAVMPGYEDQMPIALMEAWMGGPGSVPAYRGVCGLYIIALETPNGRVPQISVELCFGADAVFEETEFATVASGPTFSTSAVIRPGAVWHFNQDQGYSGDGLPLLLDVVLADANGSDVYSHVAVARMPGSTGSIKAAPVNSASGSPLVVVPDVAGGVTRVTAINLEEGTRTIPYEGPVLYAGGFPGVGLAAAFDVTTEKFIVGRIGESMTAKPVFVLRNDSAINLASASGALRQIAAYNDRVYVLAGGEGEDSRLHTFDQATGALLSTVTGPNRGTPGDAAMEEIFVNADGQVFVRIWIADPFSRAIYQVTASEYVYVGPGGDAGVTGTFAARTFFTDGSYAIVGPNFPTEEEAVYQFLRFAAFNPNEAKVSDIIADQCERAGEQRYDVSGIPDTDVVWGCRYANPASARANIDPLLTAFQIYIVDEDGLIKFKKYENITSVATISYDELGQTESGGESADAMPLSRTQEVDLPRSVTVSYLEPAFDYQTASETEVRQVTESTEDQTYELPIATNSDQANRIAKTIMFSQWRSQNLRSLKVSRKYAFLSAGDGITVEYPRGTFRLWRITSMTDTGALCEFNVEPGDAQLYTQTGVGATGYVGQTVAPLASPTRLQLIDGPILKDEDSNAGIYTALMRTAGELFVGNDDASLESRGATSAPAVGGLVEGTLGPWLPNIMDETNVMIVNVGSGELSSTTRSLLYTTTVNAAMVGVNGRWEVIQFLRAASLGSGRYMLSGLLRGMRGTERNRSTHAAGDTFVLLTRIGILRPNMDVGSIGTTKSYRAVAKGRSFSSASSQRFANTAEGLSPFSPWGARKSNAATNDQTLTWERRTRLSSNSLRGTVPLGEAVEAYSIDFFTSSSFATRAGTMASSSRTLTITSAQQAAMGLTPGATLYIRIYQLSESVGRGAALEAIV
ncbi:hypothetical protein CY658_05095 [Variovorax sp. RO1]|uniref:phage tail protein n=1 Tax=Variovorax sp. RO1 TaxID=2066034 RepID=UPI000C71779A|nr:phage tail protein [Variovorax sp. RO1]PLC06411.1 hypothetical protein CY658_05095 [Variovorax sp. RO1]